MNTRNVGLRTFSLRRRVTLMVILVVGVALLAMAFAVQTAFQLQSARELDRKVEAKLAQLDRVVKVRILHPTDFSAKYSSNGVTVVVRRPDRKLFNYNGEVDSIAELGGRVQLEKPVGFGYSVILLTDSPEPAQNRLRNVLLLVGLGTLGLTVIVLVVSIRLALRPLEVMAGLSRSIALGDRGRRLAPIRTNTELGRTAVAFDQMLDALEGAEAHARASEQQTRRFVADAAHELRTPLAGVQAAAETLVRLGPGAQQDDVERMQVMMVREARRATRLVEDLLALAQIDAGLELRFEAVHLLGLVESEVERLSLLAPSLDVEVSGDDPVVAGDPLRLGQVVGNLLDNARRHASAEGVVHVRVTRYPQHVELVVLDNGPGVPAAERERIFSRLVRLDTARTTGKAGAGLGLSIAKGIARAHGGDLACVEPPAGHRGAAFRLVLPVTTAQDLPTAPIPAVTP
ncbi:HAMP domain-containing histidine kinase [Allokutzneria sp. A3M-2-11 16]|uniref:sensor histidine kinase n=1 Tax=Allokutzneria sp. A3M-2-11 16 TaxID=2962043 RepID=UPI0020B73AE5|nr:HAMP domain-containing sensor histidine kinase [Allokutzneria sp. A3M-2-11 16]MCP3804156.1 HAMP domain-containing histidine kinase [Allokutzneria sp. A3M-2-11 16]